MKQWGEWTALVVLAAAGAVGAAASQPPAPESSGRHVRDGMVIDFSARPAPGTGPVLREGQLAEIEFRITEEATGNPVRSNVPAAWMDMADMIRAREGGVQKSCKEKIGLYLRGIVGIRPMVDLNSHLVVVMNQEPSVTVVDPLVSMAGSTSTVASVPLDKRGMDWASHAASKAIYVTMPEAHAVAVIDTDTWKSKTSIDAGRVPTRLAAQPDARFLWVGNDADGKAGGVTVIDPGTQAAVGFVATGRGHHEIAFSADSRHAFVTNRDDGTVTMIDTQTRKKVRDVRTGPAPIAIARSALSGSVYVADAKDGSIAAIDAKTGEVTRRMFATPGLGPLRFSADGRFGIALNPSQDRVYVIDASSDALIHALDLKGKPFQVVFSRAFAYIRTLESDRVTMVNLATLGRGKKPIMQSFQAGAGAPGTAPGLVIADTVAAASTEAAMMIVNPVENATYFYMEGMNAPASSYKPMGSRARAVMVLDRSLKEAQPGVYRSWVRLPAAGRFDVAVLLDSPRIMHCFAADVAEDPKLVADRNLTHIEFLAGAGPAKAGEKRAVRFRLTDAATREPRKGLNDVRVLSFRAPGRGRSEKLAREVEDGVYEVELALDEAGAYYVHMASTSAKFGFHDLPFVTIRVASRSPS